MATITIPSSLARFANGKKDIQIEASTIREALAKLFIEYPELKDSIIDHKEDIRRFVNIYIQEKDIRFINNQDSEIEENDKVTIITAVAGG